MHRSSKSVCATCASASTGSGGVFDLPRLRSRHEELEQETARPEFWNDRERAQRISREQNRISEELAFFERLSTNIDDSEVLLELADEAGDEETRGEAAAKLAEVASALEDAELRQLLGGEHDAGNALLSINAGAGGTDACDWAEMLFRMYLRWAERRGYETEILDLQHAEEAGIRTATISVSGDYAYGYLNAEQGVHRLVRISPFDAQARRHTAFASVTAVPEIDDSIEVELDEADLRVDTYRSSGAGGQHVNKTDSAVRLTHIPTGIVAACQNERSQHKNKATAMKMLRAQLYERSRLEHEEKMAELTGETRSIRFGSQIRSYTLHPQQRVKDHRTNLESGDVTGVLDGDLDRFIRGTLLQQSAERGSGNAAAEDRRQ